MCANGTVGTWLERPNVCRTESASMCRSLFGTKSVRNENNRNPKVNQIILYRIVTRQLKIIRYRTENVHLYKDNEFFILQGQSIFYFF